MKPTPLLSSQKQAGLAATAAFPPLWRVGKPPNLGKERGTGESENTQEVKLARLGRSPRPTASPKGGKAPPAPACLSLCQPGSSVHFTKKKKMC